MAKAIHLAFRQLNNAKIMETTLQSNIVIAGTSHLTKKPNDTPLNVIELMCEATQRAAEDAGNDNILSVVDQIIVAQEHSITASELVAGSPLLASSTVSQTHDFIASGVTSGAPAVGLPSAEQTHALTAIAIVSGAPAIAQPALQQRHEVSAANLVSGIPFTGQAILTEIIKYILTAANIVSEPPSLGTPLVNGSEARNVSISSDSRNKAVLTNSLNVAVVSANELNKVA